MTTYRTFLGTYTRNGSEGIYEARMDTEAGAIVDVEVAARTDDPSFLATDPTESYLYAANEIEAGSVTAYRIEEDGLIELDRLEIGPAAPCHVSVDDTGSYVFAAHYFGGATSIAPIHDDGRLGPATVYGHEGSSVHPDRQTEPHPHSANVGPSNERLYVPDLGTDEIVIYEIDRKAGELHHRTSVDLHEGAGPRHMAWDVENETAYVINELDSTLTRYRWKADSGALFHQATVDTLRDDPVDENYPADLHVHPNGRYVYGSNRGEDNIAVFDASGAGISLIALESTRGEWPRNFTLSPAGDHLFVANEHSDNIVTFEIDSDGVLTRTGHETDVPMPVCILPLTKDEG